MHANYRLFGWQLIPTYTCRLCVLYFAIVLVTPAVLAQSTDQTVAGNRDVRAIEAARDAVVLSEPYEVGAELAAPEAPPVARSETAASVLVLNCRMICSPDQPRQTLTEVSWEDLDAARSAQPSVMSETLNRLRLDIVGASARFEDGDFGTARLSAIPGVVSETGTGIDLQAVRLLQQPALLQPVRANTIGARDPTLPTPEAMKALGFPDGRSAFSAAALEAVERDDLAGGLGRIQVTAQTVETRRGRTYRIMLIEGMQPGQTYRLRLVDDQPTPASTSAATVTTGICRVRVCPADFKNQ